MSPLLLASPHLLAWSQHWGGKQEREGAGSQAAVRRRMLRSNKPFHTEATDGAAVSVHTPGHQATR